MATKKHEHVLVGGVPLCGNAGAPSEYIGPVCADCAHLVQAEVGEEP